MGDTQSIQVHTEWLLSLLECESKVKTEGEVFRYKDLDRELQILKLQIHFCARDL